MSSKTTQTRVERETLKKAQRELPDFLSSEIFKAGVQVLTAVDKTGKFIYGKNVWKKLNKK